MGIFLIASTLVSRGGNDQTVRLNHEQGPQVHKFLDKQLTLLWGQFETVLYQCFKEIDQKGHLCVALVLCSNKLSMMAMILSLSVMLSRRKLTYIIQIAGLVPSPMGKTSYL